MIGIIGAMDEEVAMLKEKLTEVQVETKAATKTRRSSQCKIETG